MNRLEQIANQAGLLRNLLLEAGVDNAPDIWDVRHAVKALGGEVGWAIEHLEVRDQSSRPNLKVSILIPPDLRDGTTTYRFCLAHALGHWMLHMGRDSTGVTEWIDSCSAMHRAGVFDYTTKEIEANTFAYALLMPADRFRDVVAQSRIQQFPPVDAIRRTFQVSETSAIKWGQCLGVFPQRMG